MKQDVFVKTLLAIAAEIKESALRAEMEPLNIQSLSFEDVEDIILAIVQTLTEKEINKLKN